MNNDIRGCFDLLFEFDDTRSCYDEYHATKTAT